MGRRKNIITGIYKITSPTGKIYIGQSINIHKRWGDYYYTNEKSGKTNINKSILKYGFYAHKFEIVYELPLDVSEEVLTKYEQLFIDAYKETGITLLNICQFAKSTRGYSPSSETRRKISESNKGRAPLVFTDEIRKKISLSKLGNKATLGYKHTEETKIKMSTWQIGRKMGPMSDDAKRHLSQSLKGIKRGPLTESHRQNLSNSLKGNKSSLGRVLSEETKDKISKSLKGTPSAFKGKKHSLKTRKILSDKTKAWHQKNKNEQSK